MIYHIHFFLFLRSILESLLTGVTNFLKYQRTKLSFSLINLMGIKVLLVQLALLPADAEYMKT